MPSLVEVFPQRLPSLFKSRYQHTTTLNSRGGRAVLALAFIPDARQILVSGGYEGIKVWDILGERQIDIPPCAKTAVVTSIHCLPNGCLAYGSNMGDLVVCLRSADHGTAPSEWFRPPNILTEKISNIPIVSMDSHMLPNNPNPRLAIGSADGSVSLLAVAPDGLETIYRIELPGNKRVSAVAFHKSREPTYLCVFTQDGHVVKLSCNTGTVISQFPTGTKLVGSAALSTVEGKDIYVIDNKIDGFDLFNIDDGFWLKNFKAVKPEEKMANTVVFAEGDNLVVGGSNKEKVYIYDTMTGKLKDILRHKGWGIVQVVATHSLSQDTHLIAVAQSGLRGNIAIWVRKEKPKWISIPGVVRGTVPWVLVWIVGILCGLSLHSTYTKHSTEVLDKPQGDGVF